MKSLSCTVTDFFVDKGIVDRTQKDIYEYGLELIIADIINFTLILTISALVKSLVTGVLFSFCFPTLRRFCGGYHAKKRWTCRVFTISTFLAVWVCAQLLSSYGVWLTVPFGILSLAIMLLYSPVENPSKPLSVNGKSRNRKRSLLIFSIYGCTAIILSVFGYQEGMVVSLTILAVVLLIIVSQILKRKEGSI